MRRVGILLAYAAFLAWTLFPVAWLILTSLKPAVEAFQLPPSWSFTPRLDNYREILGNPEIIRAFWNSAFISIAATLLVLVVSLLAGYGYSRYQFRGKSASAFFLLVTRMFPPVVIVPSVFSVLHGSMLYDSSFTLIVLYASFTVSLSTWMMKAFFDDIPLHIEEAALVDGYTRFGAFMKVTLPIAMPGVIATAIFTFILSWNEFLFAFMFTSEDAKTAPVAFVGIILRESGVQWHLMSAGACLLMLPTLGLSWFVHKYFVKGLGLGAVKG